MKLLAQCCLKCLSIMLVASSLLFAQGGRPDNPLNQQRVLDACQIVGQSLAAAERSWQARDYYTYTERDEDRRLDALGQLKSENIDSTRMILVNGIRFEQLERTQRAASIGRGTEKK
jgi:hypothetical protein